MAEVPATRIDRRAFVDITPRQTPRDSEARKQGWVPSETNRIFRLEHWEYDSERIDGFDYDIGAVLIASAEATGESELVTVLTGWQLSPHQFVYPWDSEDPK